MKISKRSTFLLRQNNISNSLNLYAFIVLILSQFIFILNNTDFLAYKLSIIFPFPLLTSAPIYGIIILFRALRIYLVFQPPQKSFLSILYLQFIALSLGLISVALVQEFILVFLLTFMNKKQDLKENFIKAGFTIVFIRIFDLMIINILTILLSLSTYDNSFNLESRVLTMLLLLIVIVTFWCSDGIFQVLSHHILKKHHEHWDVVLLKIINRFALSIKNVINKNFINLLTILILTIFIWIGESLFFLILGSYSLQEFTTALELRIQSKMIYGGESFVLASPDFFIVICLLTLLSGLLLRMIKKLNN